MNVLPKDPGDGGRKYVYYTPPDNNNPQTYYLYASLDNTSDPQANKCTNKYCPSGTYDFSADLCGGSGCNYGVSTPNVTP